MTDKPKTEAPAIRDYIIDAARDHDWMPPDVMVGCIAVAVSIAQNPASRIPLPKLVEIIAQTYKDASAAEKRRKEGGN